jgi:tetratricopeptide (TPR) repeat protein
MRGWLEDVAKTMPSRWNVPAAIREVTMQKAVLACLVVAMLTMESPQVLSEGAVGDPSQLPMYGGLDRNADPILKGADEALIDGTTKEFGSRAIASQRFVDQGFRFYFQNDLQTAMRRFNQGWLLNPNNPDVYYGFMAVLNDRQEFCAAREMAEKAFELGLRRKPEELADAGRVYAICAVQEKSLSDEIKAAYARKSSQYYTEALQLQPNSSYVYGSWATASYWLGDYVTAWKYVKLERQNGGKPGKKFLKMLKHKMREPK